MNRLPEVIPRAVRPLTTQVLGWALLVLSVYPWVVSKDGSRVFKLDAWIYYHAIGQWHDGGSLYDWWAEPVKHLWPFTYPPFAAWVMTPLTWLDEGSAQALMVVLTPAATAVTGWACLRALGVHDPTARAAAPWLALLGVVVLEPVGKTMEYGQVNAVLMALVAVDLLVLPGSRWRGALTGLAAAFKLTPAIAVLVLLARRETASAMRMVASAALATTVAALASPTETREFFGRYMWDSSRAGFADFTGNQNLKALVARWLPEPWWSPGWALLTLITVILSCLLLYRIDRLREPHRRAEPRTHVPTTPEQAGSHPSEGLVLLTQVSVAMTLGLLISPISWSHHWVWCLPFLMALVAIGVERTSGPALGAALAGATVFGLAMHWWFPEQNHVEQSWPMWATVLGSSYTWWALGAGVVLWRWVTQERRATLPTPGQAPAPRLPGGSGRADTGSPSPQRLLRENWEQMGTSS